MTDSITFFEPVRWSDATLVKPAAQLNAALPTLLRLEHLIIGSTYF
jgi:hypothetical protein